jgi:cobalt/nickel transport system ATP-binding protein
MSEALLKLENVSYRYPDGTAALDNCTLSIQRGKRTVVLGANGAGKTTMFLHLNGILRPSAGQLYWEETPLDYSRRGMRELRSRVGLVFQNPDSQLFSASVREDVSFGPMNLGLEERIVRDRVADALRAVRMTECADKPVHNLSYGQKKRVCIAGVLAMQPDLVVLDEPMAGLDAAMQKELAAVLDHLHTIGITVIIATHDLDFAYGWADEAIVLRNGQLLAHGNAAEVLLQPDVQAELGASPLVADIATSLTLTGMDVRVNGYLPRNKSELLKAISEVHRQENNR